SEAKRSFRSSNGSIDIVPAVMKLRGCAAAHSGKALPYRDSIHVPDRGAASHQSAVLGKANPFRSVRRQSREAIATSARWPLSKTWRQMLAAVDRLYALPLAARANLPAQSS